MGAARHIAIPAGDELNQENWGPDRCSVRYHTDIYLEFATLNCKSNANVLSPCVNRTTSNCQTEAKAILLNQNSANVKRAAVEAVDFLDAMATGKGTENARSRLRIRLTAAQAVFRYQPQIDLQNGRIGGVESILCVPGRNAYRPATGLVAELDAAGLGLALTECQLWDACREQRGWMHDFAYDFPIGVPVSKWVLGNELLMPLAKQILAESGLPPKRLELEVEETALGVSVIARHAFTSVGDAGLSIAVDGFNAVYANLRVLAMSPISKVRVAALPLLRSGADTLEKLVFHGILGAARGLGITVCATGVTSPELLAAVLSHGRPLAQGIELAPMLDSAAFLQCLQDRNETTATLPLMSPNIAASARATEFRGDAVQMVY
jgi:EAL domain-containing protein (putative c-di-GMP-specific phosphodiesterase class I)